MAEDPTTSLASSVKIQVHKARGINESPTTASKPRTRITYFLSLGRTRSILGLICVTALPVVLTTDLWRETWRGDRPLAWDGSGHFALASIYSETIFPDTFGWTNAYFGGMPFPNFYPPLFYWCVALVHHTHLLSFTNSFKLVVVLPVLLLPVAVWALAWGLTEGDSTVATAAALLCVPLLVDYRFRMELFPSGLDYVSTFQVGLYTHPLGFILLAAWFVVYTRWDRQHWQIAIASFVLGLTVLANFFNAVTATAFLISTALTDAAKWWNEPNLGIRDKERRKLLAHLISPLISAGLVLFWAVPMISEYSYFVTRPLTASVIEYIPPIMWYWYALAMVGFIIWLRRPTPALMPYMLGCITLEFILVFSSEVAPRWFPLQPLRLLSTLNLLLAVPCGHAVTALTTGLVTTGTRMINLIRSFRHCLPLSRCAISVLRKVVNASILLMVVLSTILFVETPYYARVFSAGFDERIDPILDYAKHHVEGRYLVEHSMYTYPGSAADVRALTSYLGSQGNEAVSVAFREASPNSLFFNPLVGALSSFSDTFGISSLLVDDIDFAEQPVARHLDRASFIGVRYLVVASPRIKALLSSEKLITARHDFGLWSIFELGGKPVARAQVLPYKPALVITRFSVKERKRNQLDFIRLAEEQFSEGWFDVMLARSPERKIDKLQELDKFGALILDSYDYSDGDLAFEKLREFARIRPLILLSTDDPLYLRIRKAITEFPHAVIIERSAGDMDQWLDSEGPTTRYNDSPIRKEWQAIRRVLDSHRIPTNTSGQITSEINNRVLRLSFIESLTESAPVLIRMSYHPNWQTTDGSGVYAITPFFMLTFVRDTASIVYTRRWFDWIGLFASTTTFVFLWPLALWRFRNISTRRGAKTSHRIL